ncbi:unnamed protein product [Oikopleura dioica]|uniref:Uncharacterized protein n=1 Tax=Oikopleura dioica TaxID=34765 RepID=E4Y9Q3_OIKDI|nr:unnamed protein product [Oikopleura dioica]
MAVMSGCFGASASFPLLWDYVIDSSDVVTLPRIFYLWCVIYALSSIPKFLFFTPWRVPKALPQGYCLLKNTWIRSCRGETEDSDTSSKQNQLQETLKIFKSLKIYLLFIGYGFFMLRLQSQIAWMSGGWPEWVKRGEANVTQEEIEDFNTSINRLYSVSGISLILLNVIPGCILDYSKNRSKTVGIGIFKGYCILIAIAFVFNTAASIMQGFQNTSIAYASIFMNLLGKSFGISWSPAWLYIFSPVMYGSVVGFFTLIGVLVGLINQPMFNYCKENDDFATMNFIQGKLN